MTEVKKEFGMRVMENGERIRVPLGCTGKLWEIVREREAWCAAFHGVSKSRPGLSHKTQPQGKVVNSSASFSLQEE